MARKKDATTWRHSEAKKLLYADVISGVVPVDETQMNAQAVCDCCSNHPDFLLSDFHDRKKFPARLNRLRDKIKGKNNRQDRDAAALANDRLLFPRPSSNYRGEPDWANSNAKKLLADDIANGRHLALTKKKLWKSRPECQETDLDVFRGRVCQMLKSIKFEACVTCKRDKKKTADDEER